VGTSVYCCYKLSCKNDKYTFHGTRGACMFRVLTRSMSMALLNDTSGLRSSIASTTMKLCHNKPTSHLLLCFITQNVTINSLPAQPINDQTSYINGCMYNYFTFIVNVLQCKSKMTVAVNTFRFQLDLPPVCTDNVTSHYNLNWQQIFALFFDKMTFYILCKYT